MLHLQDLLVKRNCIRFVFPPQWYFPWYIESYRNRFQVFPQCMKNIWFINVTGQIAEETKPAPSGMWWKCVGGDRGIAEITVSHW